MEKRFSTALGKAFLLVLFGLFEIVTFASIVLGIVFIQGEFYLRSENVIWNEVITDGFRTDGYRFLEDNIPQEYLMGESNLLVQIINNQNEIVLQSDDFNENAYYHTEYYEVASGETFSLMDKREDSWTINFQLMEGLPKQDKYHFLYHVIHLGYQLRYWIFVIFALSMIGTFMTFIELLSVSGHKKGHEEIVPGVFNWVFADVETAFVLFGVGVIVSLYSEVNRMSEFIFTSIFAFFYSIVLVLWCMSMANRYKRGVLWKGTLIYKLYQLANLLLKKIISLISQIPLVYKTVLFVGVISIVELVMFIIFGSNQDPEKYLVFWFIEKLILVPLIILIALQLKKLEHSGKMLSEGNLSYITDTSSLHGELKVHGENLNNIAMGMSKAVEKQITSERMKTELITNVSHDLKTPLTSIINYSDLICKEKSDNPKIDEYAEVLHRQSTRLKRLIEDLIEASKASTGNLDMEMIECDASVFLEQIQGEYEERLKEKDLTLIVKQPDYSKMMMADGRRMARVFDNLLSNIEKYALSGTRVYLSLEYTDSKVVFILKNTSAKALDISEDELMERFVRADNSRHTEGNGLGLSIAKSLVELQNGKIQVIIDGDLFKVLMFFPIVENHEENA